ncbi:MAG: hypothetical protein J6K16_07215 [Alphaproteobacteria bacterium]|nr:hypothetical protein [Alphaproteobacteria bacterium]
MMSIITRSKSSDRFCFDLWSFVGIFTVLINVASCIMLFWVPTITIAQIVWVVLVTLITIYAFIKKERSELMLMQMMFTYATFAAVIIWLTTSFWWCLIPIGLGSFIAFSIAFEDDFEGGVAICVLCTMVVMFMFACGMRIDVKNYDKAHEAQELVTINNIGSNVMFVEGQDEPLRFSHSRQVSELELKKGDVVRILRHPRNENKVLSMSVVERRSE